jgi:antitoxin component YwqK of YwqJK toxin-antitoxin module
MHQILKEEKYADGTLKSRETLLDDLSGVQTSLKEAWHYNGKPEYKQNYANEQKHGLQEFWYPPGWILRILGKQRMPRISAVDNRKTINTFSTGLSIIYRKIGARNSGNH